MSANCIKAFLSQPYGKTKEEQLYWQAFQAGIEQLAGSFRDPCLEILSARERVLHLNLKESVRMLIDVSDFTIAVITGSNPNVFWEVGYTEAQGKPVVFLVDQGAPEVANSPVLVIEALKCVYRSDVLTDLVKSRALPDEFSQHLKSYLDVAIKAAMSRIESRVFVTRDRDECSLPDIVASARTRIYLITTNLTYFSDFDNFVVTNSPKQFAFDPPVEQGVELRILTLDPDSPIVKYRAEQLGRGYDVAAFREELRDSARRIYSRYKSKHNVSIHVYDDVPMQITMLVDDQAITSVMARGRLSRRNLHFRLSMRVPGARETFENHFQEVTAVTSRPISIYGWATR